MAEDLLDRISAEDRVRMGYLTSLRREWSTTVFTQLRAEFDQRAGGLEQGTGSPAAQSILDGCPTSPWFGWLERGAQKLKWRTLTHLLEGSWEELAPAQVQDVSPDPAVSDGSVLLPDWYTSCDIHCQPGGVWGDPAAAVLYELGTKVLHIGRNNRNELHHLFVRSVLAPALAEHDPTSSPRVVDLGCGFGKSTTPIKEAFPDAEVIGIDLSEPCVRLASVRASESDLAVTFLQGDAAAIPLESESTLLVTGTMVLHEIPVVVLRRVFSEVARVLRPGGEVRFLEFMRTGDPFRDAVMDDHAWRNNEPFMPGLMDLDLERELGAAGLTDARWVPFDERGAGPTAEGFPARSEWHFPWAVLSARRAAS